MDSTIRHILLATDFGAASDAALDYAATMARALGARLHLVHILEEPYATSGPYEWHLPDTPARHEYRYQQALTALHRAAARIAEGNTITVEVRSGPITESIAKAAIDYGADLIILGTHGHVSLRHLFGGDLADRLLRIARCPVLAVSESTQARLQSQKTVPRRVA